MKSTKIDKVDVQLHDDKIVFIDVNWGNSVTLRDVEKLKKFLNDTILMPEED